jgi:Xaa-Pro aminopeptidase
VNEQRPAGGDLSTLDLTPAFRALMATGWAAPSSGVAGEAPLAAVRRERRRRLAAAFPGEVLVIPSGGHQVRNGDVVRRYRPGTEQTWLAGSREVDCVLVVDDGEAVLYQRGNTPRDSEELFTDYHSELFDGRRPALADAAVELGLTTRPLEDLQERKGTTARVLRGVDTRVEELFVLDEESDAELARWLSEARLVKDAWEVEQVRLAVQITARGFEDVVRELPRAIAHGERFVEGVFALRARLEGNDTGYLSICAAGEHATVLHWMHNKGPVRPGELMLLDMGAETEELYTADVTRTLPVSGRFTPLQRDVYDIVHLSQEAALAECRAGNAFQAPYDAAMVVMAEGLQSLGVIPSAAEVLDPDDRRHKRWTLHRISHMLGLDVHDCAHARESAYRQGTFEVGHVFTVEPGLYFQPDDLLVDPELRGIGVRIEDDVVITEDGYENLSAMLPRSADAVESWMAELSGAGGAPAP